MHDQKAWTMACLNKHRKQAGLAAAVHDHRRLISRPGDLEAGRLTIDCEPLWT